MEPRTEEAIRPTQDWSRRTAVLAAAGCHRRARATFLGLACLIVAGLLLLRSLTARAEGAPDSTAAPDSARVAEIQRAMKKFGSARISTGGVELSGHRIVAMREGVSIRYSYPSITSIRPEDERLVQWSEIDSIRVRRPSHGIGPIVGVLVGFSAGMTVAVAEDESALLDGNDVSAGPIIIGTLAGGALGWLLDHPGRWHRVYP